MFRWFGRLAYRFRWPIVVLWFAAALATLPVLPRVADVLSPGGFSSSQTESAKARALLQQNIPGYSPSTILVLFSHPTWKPTDPQFIAEAQRALSRVTSLPDVAGIDWFMQNPRQIAPDGSLAYAVIRLKRDPESAEGTAREIQQALVPTNLTVQLSGSPVLYADFAHVTEHDLRRAEIVAFPFALVALVFVFGSVVTAIIPLIVGAINVALVLGFLYLLTHVMSLSVFSLNVASMLGLGLAIDYSLFLVSRFREELLHGSVVQAVEKTVATAGRAVFFSGLTVLIGLSGLSFFEFLFMRSVGIAGMLVVLTAVLSAMTFLPAMLAIVGPRVNALTLRSRPDQTGGFWHQTATRVMRHPWFVVIPVTALLIGLALPFRNVQLSSPDATILPRSTQSRQAFDRLSQAFGQGAISPIVIAVQTDQPVNDPQTLAALYAYTRQIAADTRVERVTSIVTVDPRITLPQYQQLYHDPAHIPDPVLQAAYQQLAGQNVTAIYVYFNALPASPEARSLLHDLRHIQPPAGLHVLMDGSTAEIVDNVQRMYQKFPYAAATVILATYVVLFVLLRSALLPLKAVILNLLSLTASYGALVYIFQEGHFHRLLHFDPLGFTESSLPIILFCLLFGLSMDYEVFLLSRIREAWEQTGDNTRAVVEGLERSGRIITGAALILVIVAGAFITADVVLIKALGLSVALAVALDATLVRVLLVPATMRLLGDWNWWIPRFALRLVPVRGMEH